MISYKNKQWHNNKNLEQTKKSLQLEENKKGMTRNIEKSFEEIVASLQKLKKT